MHQETYELMDRVRNRYGITVEVYFPRAEAVAGDGARARARSLLRFGRLRQLCCGVRKVEPLERALAGLDAWITGLRPDQSVTRADVRAVEVDEVHGGRIKLNPLVRWSASAGARVRRATSRADQPLHAQGYPTRRVRAVHALGPARRG